MKAHEVKIGGTFKQQSGPVLKRIAVDDISVFAVDADNVLVVIHPGIDVLPVEPLENSTADYRLAIAGEGPQAGQWDDKPHRLVYDLCNEVERLRLK